MSKKNLSLLFFSIYSILINIDTINAQCTTTTVNIDFAGAQANGCCNVCGNDYRCYTNGSATACTFGASFSNTFADPVPPGNIVVSAQVNYYYSGCSGGAGTMATSINGVPIGNANFSVNNCSCGSCFFTSTPNTPFNCGMPSYNYGGSNTVSGNVSGTECIDRIQVVLCYRSSTPNAGTASSSASSVCSGQPVNLTLTGYQTGGTIQWQSAPTSGGPWTNIPGATSATYASGPLSSNICYRAQVTCGGVNYSNVVCITVNSLPSVSVSNATICAGQTTTLTSVVNPVGGSYNWTPGGMTTSSIVVSPPSTQVYNLTYTDPNGCVGTGSGTVTVNTSPAITVNSPTICAGQSATITANGIPGGGTYLWSPSGNTSNVEVVTPPSTSTYTVQYTTGSGCSGTAVSTVVVNPIPTVNVDNIAVCPGGTGVIGSTVSPTGGSYLWSPGGQITSTIAVTPTASTTYTLLYTSPAGCTNTAVSNVTLSPTPTVAVNNATICSGQSTTLSSVVNPPGGTYSWTPGGFTTSSIVVSPPSTQVYNLEYTNGCSTIVSATVFVNTSPNLTVNSPSLCAGQTTTLVANGTPGGGTYNWTPGGATTSSIIITPPASTNYTVTYTDANTCTAVAVSTVIVNPIPTVAVNNATICGAGGSATLTATVNPTGGLYFWSPGGMTTPTVVVSPATTTTYNLQYIAPTGCSNTAVGVVYVSNLPTVAVNDATLCSAPGASVILTATVSPSGGTFTWSPIGGGGPIVVVSPTSSTGYTVTYTEPGGCSASAVGYVTVMPGFSFADFTYPNHPCVDNQPYTFSATVSGSGPYAYQWYFGNGSSPSTATTLSASVNYAYGGIKDVSLVVNNLSSGCKDSIVHQVTIEDLPFVNFTASSPTCVTDTVYFNNYSWIGGSATIASWYWDFGDGNNSTAFQPSHLYAAGGTYTVYLVATSDFGCDDTLYKVINVSPLTVAGNVTSNATVCAVSNTGTLNLNGNNGNVISWMYSTDNGLTWLPIVNTNTSYVYTNLQQTTIFGAVVQSGSCPTATTSPNATITVDAASNAGFIRRDTLVCFPINQGTLTLTNYTGTIVDWFSSNNSTTWTALGNTSPTYTFANLTDTTYYAVIVQNGTCPPDTSNTPYTTVWVRYFNSAQVVPSTDTSISIGFTVQLNAMGGYFYAWSPNYNISDTTVHNPFVWPNKDTSYIVYVQDKYGCVDADTVKVFVLKDYKLVIANTLTPNGDNYNDFFWIGMIEYYPNNEVIVFNRYGQEIFKGNNYDNKKVYWDGTYQGNKVPDGAYYYVIKFKDNNTVFKGSINVISSH